MHAALDANLMLGIRHQYGSISRGIGTLFVQAGVHYALLVHKGHTYKSAFMLASVIMH